MLRDKRREPRNRAESGRDPCCGHDRRGRYIRRQRDEPVYQMRQKTGGSDRDGTSPDRRFRLYRRKPVDANARWDHQRSGVCGCGTENKRVNGTSAFSGGEANQRLQLQPAYITRAEAVYELPFYLVQPANCRAKRQRSCALPTEPCHHAFGLYKLPLRTTD